MFMLPFCTPWMDVWDSGDASDVHNVFMYTLCLLCRGDGLALFTELYLPAIRFGFSFGIILQY